MINKFISSATKTNSAYIMSVLKIQKVQLLSPLVFHVLVPGTRKNFDTLYNLCDHFDIF